MFLNVGSNSFHYPKDCFRLIKDALNGNYDHLCFGGYSSVGKVNTEFRTLLCVHSQAVEEEDKMTPEQLAIKNVGKQVRRL